MNPTLKNILIGLGSILAGAMFIGLGHYISNMIIPPPSEMDMNDGASIALHADKITPGGWALVLLSHAMGPLVAGWLAAKFSSHHPKQMVHIIGIVFTIMGILNLSSIPSPMWFNIADTCMYIPMAIIGGKLASRLV